MKVDELPVELLMKVFSYLSSYKKVSLVSRCFYEVACRVNDKNISLTLDRDLLILPGDELLRSILKCNRKISKVVIYFSDLTLCDLIWVISIVSKFSDTIKYLGFKGGSPVSIKWPDFLKILSLVPNAEHLCFERLRLSHADEMSSNEDLNLKHLRILDLSYCGELFQVVFNRLPAGVLIKLILRGGFLLSLDTLFSRQTSIKKLSLEACESDDEFPAHILNNLELKSLEIRYMVIETAALSRQTKLKSLTLNRNHQDDDHLIEVVANTLTELQKLNCDIIATPVNDFMNIERLKNLKHLRMDFWYRRTDIVDGLIELDNSRIVTLQISDCYNLTNHQIQTLAKSAPKLKVLNILDYLKYDQVTWVLRNFNFVECLSFGCFSQDENYASYLNQSESGNTKLTELSASILQYEPPVLKKMIADFPNLKKLQIESEKAFTSSQFRLIVDGFTKMESLGLCHGEKFPLTIDDFKYLRDQSRRMQTLRLQGTFAAYVHCHLKDLETLFEVVKYSRKPIPSLLLKI